jgi:hypothetical protein
MSFQPAIPMGGLAGWRFLERTGEAQRAAFDKGPALQREIAYFTANIGKIDSPEALVKDRRLLAVALGAFGLEGEIDKRFFVRKVLEGGTDDPRSLANRLSEPGFRRFAAAFGFGNEGGGRTGEPGFAAGIAAQFRERRFEAAVGEVDDTMRLALNFRREIAKLAEGAADGAGWFTVLGSRPLREVVQTALGLPKEFARIDVDRQRDMVRGRMAAVFGDGSIGFFKDPANVEKVLVRFLARAQIAEAAGQGATSPALALLQGSAGGGGSAGLFNLLLSRR